MADSVERRLSDLERKLEALPKPGRIEDVPDEWRYVWYPLVVAAGIEWRLRDLADFDGSPVEVRQDRPAEYELRNTVALLREALEKHTELDGSDEPLREWLAAVAPMPAPPVRDVPLDLGCVTQIQPLPPRPPAPPRPKKPPKPEPTHRLYGPDFGPGVPYEPGSLAPQGESRSRWRGIGRD